MVVKGHKRQVRLSYPRHYENQRFLFEIKVKNLICWCGKNKLSVILWSRLRQKGHYLETQRYIILIHVLILKQKPLL